MKWAVSFPEESILLVRPCLVAICHDNRPAAKLLSVLLYRHSIRQEHQSDAENINEVRGDNSQDTTFRIYRKQSKLVTDMCNEITEKTLHDVAVPVLQLLGYLDVDESPAIHCYDLHIDAVVNALIAYKQGPKQLEDFLTSHLQLEKFLIDSQLEKVLINKKNFQLALEKVLIANRNISNNKRGRKPRSEETGEPQSEEPQINIEIDSKISNEEGEGATSAEDRNAPINLEIAKKKRETNPRMLALSVSSHSQRLSETSEEDEDEEPTVKMPITKPQHTIPTTLLEAPAATVLTSPPKDSVQQGAMALTARDIKAQNEKRAKELWAIIEDELHTTFTENQRKAHKDGIASLIADDLSDEAIRTGLQALNTFERRTFTVQKFYGWLPTLSAKAPVPGNNGKTPAPFVIDQERNQRNIEAMKARNAEKRRLAASG